MITSCTIASCLKITSVDLGDSVCNLSLSEKKEGLGDDGILNLDW